MGTVTCFTQLKQCTAGYNFSAVTDKGLQNFFQVQQFWLAINQRYHIDAEHVLHHGLFVEVIQDNLGNFTTPQFNDNTHAVFIRLIAQFGNTVDLLVFNQFGYLFQQSRLVHLVGQFSND